MANPTEDTINDLLASYLRSKGLNVLTQFSARLPHGKGRPDFEIRKGGILYGECEWFSSYTKGYDQAIGFGDIPGASGYFLIGYPDELKHQVSQGRLNSVAPEVLLAKTEFRGMLKTKDLPVTLFHGTLDKIPAWLSKGLEGQKLPQDPTEFVRLMNDFVIQLTQFLPSTQTFDSTQLFQHILATVPKAKGEIDAARRAAAYLLLNQLVFYRILQTSRLREDTKRPAYTKIDPHKLSTPGDLKKIYFNEVLKDDYQAIFDFDVASIFPLTSLGYIKDLLRRIEELEPEQFTSDLLGNIFHKLIPLEVRKPVAAYYTNPMAARLLAKLSIDNFDDAIADFACGSGTLLMAAYNEKAGLLGTGFSEKYHKQFIEKDITGVDIMPFAAHLAVVQLALKNPGYWTDQVRIAVFDSTILRPGFSMSSFQKVMPRGQSRLHQFQTEEGSAESMVTEGVVSPAGAGKGFTVQAVNVVIMNPPFTRKQQVKKEFREMLTERFTDYSNYASKAMNYYGYFILLADRFLQKGDRLAMVLPVSFLREESLLGIRRLISERYDIKFLILSGWRSAFSEDTSFREILLVAQKGKLSDPKCIAAKLNVMPSEHNVDFLANILLHSKDDYSKPEEHSELEISTLSQQQFRSLTDWRALVPGEQEAFNYPPSPSLSKLSSIVPTVIQGIRFHSASYKTNPKNTLISRPRTARTRVEWAIREETEHDLEIQNQETAVTVNVPKSVLLSATRSISGIPSIEPTQVYDYAVIARFQNDENFWDDPRPDNILRLRLPHLHSRQTHLVVAGYGNVDLTGSGTHVLAFASSVPIIPTWSLWSFKVESYDKARLLVLWWNSTFSLARLLDIRTEVRGSNVKWRKSALDETLALDETKLSKKDRAMLLATYDTLRHVQFPSLLEQFRTEFLPRVQMDIALAKVVKWPQFRTIEGLRPLYSEILAKLEELRMMMERD